MNTQRELGTIAGLFALREACAIKEQEKIPVFILYGNKGKAVCICHADRKGCTRKCQRDIVTRDRYDGWIETLYRDRYGK